MNYLIRVEVKNYFKVQKRAIYSDGPSRWWLCGYYENREIADRVCKEIHNPANSTEARVVELKNPKITTELV